MDILRKRSRFAIQQNGSGIIIVLQYFCLGLRTFAGQRIKILAPRLSLSHAEHSAIRETKNAAPTDFYAMHIT